MKAFCTRVLALLALAALLSPAHAASVFVEDLTWTEVRDAIASGKTTAIYYAGSTEQNGPHMAIGKHNFVARAVAERIAAAVGNALVYPIMPYAPTGDAPRKTGHMRYPGSVSVSEATFAAVARDVARSALAAGFRHVVLMGDHGGGQQTLEAVARELDGEARSHGARVHYIGDLYFKTESDVADELRARGRSAGAHAGLSDTAALMAVDPAGVRVERLAPGEPGNGVDGDPRGASAALGRELLEIKVKNAVAQIRRVTAAEPAGKSD